jgi:two-component system, NarL family, sensor histidine kinase DevS
MDEDGATTGKERLLIEAGMTLSSELDLDRVLERIVDLAVSITEARYGALGVLTEDMQRIERFITKGITPGERERIGENPVGHGMLGLLIEENRSLRIRDIAADPRSSGFPPHHPSMRSFLGAPIRGLGKVFGNIYLTEKQGAEEFTLDDQRALEVLATQAGVAIDNARLYEETRLAGEQRRRLELLEDRERIAKELHDGVIQSLFAVGMSLQGTGAMSGDPETSRRIEGAVEEIDRAIRDLRNYIFELRPDILADRQLDQALTSLAVDFQEHSQVVTVVDVDPRMASELSGLAADIVQLAREALSNVGRHADAQTCRVSLRRTQAGGVLEIDDDGVGFDVAALDGEGMGLANLRSRAASVGAVVEITSQAGEGTAVRATFPL